MSNIRSQKQTVLLLASIAAILPFSIDVYLPAVPAIAQDLNTYSTGIQTTLSIFLIGQAIGLLIGGTISDIKGRKNIVLIGLIIFIISSFLLMLIQNIEQMMLLRLIQAIGSGMIAAMVGAIVRDHYEGQQAAQIFTSIGLIMMLAPLLAPSIGAGLFHLFNWHAIFAFLGIYASIALVLQYLYLPQKPITPQKRQKLSQIWSEICQRYKTVLSTRVALGFLFIQSFSFASMFSFLTESPFVYMEYFKLSENQFAWLFALNLITMMLFNRITAWRLKRNTKPQNILITGIFIQLLLNLILLFSSIANPNMSTLLYTTLVMFSVGTQGFISANAQACFMQFFNKESGSANGVLLSCQALIAATIGYITTLLHNNTSYIMPLMMSICSILGLVLLYYFSRSTLNQRNLKNTHKKEII